MKRKDLEKHLREQGCKFLEEGGRHTKWINVNNNNVTVIPRHNEVDSYLARAICKQLGVEVIKKK